jgi:hypothetical protein
MRCWGTVPAQHRIRNGVSADASTLTLVPAFSIDLRQRISAINSFFHIGQFNWSFGSSPGSSKDRFWLMRGACLGQVGLEDHTLSLNTLGLIIYTQASIHRECHNELLVFFSTCLQHFNVAASLSGTHLNQGHYIWNRELHTQIGASSYWHMFHHFLVTNFTLWLAWTCAAEI